LTLADQLRQVDKAQCMIVIHRVKYLCDCVDDWLKRYAMRCPEYAEVIDAIRRDIFDHDKGQGQA